MQSCFEFTSRAFCFFWSSSTGSRCLRNVQWPLHPPGNSDAPMDVNHAQLQLLLARAQYDLAAALSAALIVLGDRLGLYRLLATARLTAQEIADRSGLDFHYIESWLLNQTAGGYVTFDAASVTYSLSPEQQKAMVDETSAVFLPASFALANSLAAMTDALEREMRNGTGLAADRYSAETFHAIGRMAKAKSASIIGSFSDATRSVLTGGCAGRRMWRGKYSARARRDVSKGSRPGHRP